jgi:hypothetical protein
MGKFKLAGIRVLGRRTAGMAAATMLVAAVSLGMVAATAPGALADTAPVFTADSPSLTATAGSVYSYTFAASGSPAPTFALSGAPSWLSITAATGVLSGTIPAGTTTFSYTVTATNSAGSVPGSFTVAVSQPAAAPVFTADSPSLTATAGSVYSYTFAASGSPAPTFALSGAPSWLSITAATGALSGTIPAGTTTFSYTVTATNSAGNVSKSYTVAVSQPAVAPVFTADSPSLTATAGSAYSYTFAASGTPAPTFALSGAPSWLSVNAATGALSGTIPAGTTSFSYTVTATNSAGSTPKSYTVAVSQPAVAPAFTADSPPLTVTAGRMYSYTFAASGTPAATFALSGPRWLSINAATGALSGRVPLGTRFFTYAVTATNSAGNASKTFTVSVRAIRKSPQVIYFRYPHLVRAGTWTVLSATGGRSGNPVTFSVDRSSGRGVCRVSGRTLRFLADGTCVIDAYQAGNAYYDPASAQVRILVGTAPRFTHYAAPRTAVAGKVYAYRFVAFGYPAPVFKLIGAPHWLKINSRTGAVSGIVPRGTRSFTYEVVAVNPLGRVAFLEGKVSVK